MCLKPFPAVFSRQRASIDVEGGKRINLAPGMNATAEIKTGWRRVIECLRDLIQRSVSESLGGER
jgi:hemolysin D